MRGKDAWSRMVYRVDGRFGHISFRFRKRHPSLVYSGDRVCRAIYIYIYIAPVAEWLERALAVRQVSGSIPGMGGHKNLALVWNLLSTSFFVKLSRGSGFILLNA